MTNAKVFLVWQTRPSGWNFETVLIGIFKTRVNAEKHATKNSHRGDPHDDTDPDIDTRVEERVVNP